MKHIFILFLFIAAAAFSGYAQQVPVLAAGSKAAETIRLDKPGHDFGKIQQGRPVTHSFEVTNTGKKPLFIESVQASCGCTTPEWSQEPVPPGATTKIKVGFNAASEGPFSKTITIVYNNNQVRTLTISGDVYPAPATSAPLNASLSF